MRVSSGFTPCHKSAGKRVKLKCTITTAERARSVQTSVSANHACWCQMFPIYRLGQTSDTSRTISKHADVDTWQLTN